ncbi:AP endonuclease [Epithele typhae]|uniref:AP endonuclease n=1 Tax=Epithele typhae TaxID=378194 RepID=UPI002007DD3A|nr:AP endonuclease [Epithele typhae]KAH9939351.1 AP endonuclease [Epithele typhae]
MSSSASPRRSSRVAASALASTSSRLPSSSPLSFPSDAADDNPRPTKRARAQRGEVVAPPKQPTKRRTKDAAESPRPQDYVPRAENAWKLGPHVSSAGGVENAVVNAAAVGANAFGLFLKSQRKWESPALKEDSVEKFKARMKTFGYSPAHVLPHESYLVNLANPDGVKREKSYQCFLDDLKRCEQLGLELYNFHPGSTLGSPLEDALARIASCINRAHKETQSVVVVLENMVCQICNAGSFCYLRVYTQAGSGNVVGSRFIELGKIIEQVDDKSRVAVCLDTCEHFFHVFAQKLRSHHFPSVAEFDRDVGASYLRGMHLNDSKGALASKKDRHENIGLGHLGVQTFDRILSDPRTRGIPLILETPAYDVGTSGGGKDSLAKEGMVVWRTEVAVLNRIAGRSPGTPTEDGVVVSLDDEELDTCRAEVQAVVHEASKSHDGKGRKAGQSASKRGGRKGKRHAEDADEDVDSCDDSWCVLRRFLYPSRSSSTVPRNRTNYAVSAASLARHRSVSI